MLTQAEREANYALALIRGIVEAKLVQQAEANDRAAREGASRAVLKAAKDEAAEREQEAERYLALAWDFVEKKAKIRFHKNGGHAPHRPNGIGDAIGDHFPFEPTYPDAEHFNLPSPPDQADRAHFNPQAVEVSCPVTLLCGFHADCLFGAAQHAFRLPGRGNVPPPAPDESAAGGADLRPVRDRPGRPAHHSGGA